MANLVQSFTKEQKDRAAGVIHIKKGDPREDDGRDHSKDSLLTDILPPDLIRGADEKELLNEKVGLSKFTKTNISDKKDQELLEKALDEGKIVCIWFSKTGCPTW